jgi:hypothetical protein
MLLAFSEGLLALDLLTEEILLSLPTETSETNCYSVLAAAALGEEPVRRLRSVALRLIFSMSFLLFSICIYFCFAIIWRCFLISLVNSSSCFSPRRLSRVLACFQRRPTLMRRTRRITRVMRPARVPMRAPRLALAS